MEKTPGHERLTPLIDLLHEAEGGRLDQLKCPECRNTSVSVWFTNPSEGSYRTWLICGNCNFDLRAQNAGRPKHFSDQRLHKELDEYDKAIERKAIIKRPKSG
jgi:hypothetical protein